MKIFWEEQGYTSQTYPLVAGKIGCILSHLSIIQDGYDRGFNAIWIFQDDIEVLGDLTKIDTYIQEMNQLDPDWGLLFTDLDMRQYFDPTKLLRVLSLGPRGNSAKYSLDWFLNRNNIDDWSWGVGCPVRKAVERFSKEKTLKVDVANNNFWSFHKP